jgi:RHS repeat-associated protein
VTAQQDAGGYLTSFAYDAANRQTAVIDANGNRTSENAGGALTTYTWDAENHLLSVTNASGTETYTYTADGLRQKKVTARYTTQYVWDEQNVLHETDASLASIAQYTDPPGQWGRKFSLHRSGGSAFYVPDHQGNSRVLTDAAGAVTDTLLTDAWGVEVAASGATVNPYRAFGAWGYERDAATRLYVRARHLRVDLGRWVSRDPIGFGGGDPNMLRYVGNRLPIAADPAGLWGPFVHKCCTKELAHQTGVPRSDGRYWTFLWPDLIGEWDSKPTKILTHHRRLSGPGISTSTGKGMPLGARCVWAKASPGRAVEPLTRGGSTMRG